MEIKNKIIDKTIKRNLKVYKKIRRIYDITKLTNDKYDKKIFKEENEKLKKKHEKTFDL